jgi:hypothetical protein
MSPGSLPNGIGRRPASVTITPAATSTSPKIISIRPTGIIISMRFLVALLAILPLCAHSPHQMLAREIFQQLIEINTTDSAGDTTLAAEAMAARFRAAGWAASDVQVLAPAASKGNLVVRLRGTGPAGPILFLGHLDVVEAARAEWPFDPFVFREQDPGRVQGTGRCRCAQPVLVPQRDHASRPAPAGRRPHLSGQRR